MTLAGDLPVGAIGDVVAQVVSLIESAYIPTVGDDV